MRKALSMTLAAAALAVSGSLIGAGSAGAATSGTAQATAAQNLSGRSICYKAYVQDDAWQNFVACNGAMAGTTSLAKQVEMLNFATSGTGGLCARAHVSDVGWQSWVCVADGQDLYIGTQHQNRAIEAVELQIGNGTVSANAHLRNVGWQGWATGSYIQVGTTLQARPMEAIEVVV
ncbi:hypothetical protein ACIQF6_17005 [Kitasatospora sp. NPDC092948]|uniref:hypothetical protein n=1 Tax=Kitasatospora sp. NPDC092948 TaxID=3364088 RepID=UPI00381D7623